MSRDAERKINALLDFLKDFDGITAVSCMKKRVDKLSNLDIRNLGRADEDAEQMEPFGDVDYKNEALIKR